MKQLKRATASGPRGIFPQSLLRPQGFGEAQPRFPNDSPANRAKNRRVELIMMNN